MNPLTVLNIIRPHIVAGGIFAYSLGALLGLVAGGTLNPLLVALGYCVVFLGDLSTHFSNDYFDVELDSQVKSKKFFSGKKVLVNNPQFRSLAKNVSLTLMVLSTVVSAVVVIFLGAPTEFLVITVAANFLGWAYSAPPIRLSSRGLGELTIATATGLIIPSVGYVSIKGQLDPIFVSLSIPFMLYGFFLSLNLEAPDIESDKKGHKRTLAVRTGKRNIFILVLAVSLFATLAFLALHVSSSALDLRVLILLSLIPVTASAVGFVTSYQKRNLSRFGTMNIFSLFLLIMSLNVYCLLLLP